LESEGRGVANTILQRDRSRLSPGQRQGKHSCTDGAEAFKARIAILISENDGRIIPICIEVCGLLRRWWCVAKGVSPWYIPNLPHAREAHHDRENECASQVSRRKQGKVKASQSYISFTLCFSEVNDLLHPVCVLRYQKRDDLSSFRIQS
jgi:hypothetical protein